MQNLGVLLVATVLVLVAIAAAVRFRERRMSKRPKRRGPTDGTWTQASIALIALGSFFVGVATAGSPAGHPNQPALIAGLVIASLGVLGVVITAGAAVVRRIEDSTPPLTMVYDPSDPACDQVDGITRQVRLRVVNDGRVALRQVRVMVEPLEPEGLHTHFLHIRHDDYSDFQRSWDGENVQVGDPAYFDLFYVPPPYEHQFILSYAAEHLPNRFLFPATLRVRLTASGWLGDGRDVPHTSKVFEIVGTAEAVTLREIPN